MQRKDLMELRKRFKKDECTFTRMTGCYVNSQKEKVVTLNEVFLNLPDEEYYKYLEIAKKALSGTLGNNLLELEFPLDEEAAGGKQQFFMGLKTSGLKEDGLLDRFYDLVIDTYDYVGNYLILLFHDAYDVMVKTEDNRKLDESEEVYEYFICAICPVTLSKPGLGYLEEENKIGVRLRDWIVSPPENGFLFPAFTQRSSDIHALIYYTKNAKDPHPAFMEKGLGCGSKKTALQQKKSFQDIVKKAVSEIPDEEILVDDVFMTLQESISDMLDRNQPETPDAEPISLTSDTFKSILEECDFSETLSPRLEKAFAEEFSEEIPTADAVLDPKALAKNEQKKKEKELISEVATLKESLAKVQESEGKTNYVDPDTGEIIAADDETPPKLCDVFLRLKPERASLVKSQMIDGQKCLVIPVEEGDDIDINGIKMDS